MEQALSGLVSARQGPNYFVAFVPSKQVSEIVSGSRLSQEAPIFGGKPAFKQYLEILRPTCQVLGLPTISWHSFRRGSAADMLKHGCTVAQIMKAGGWKSCAFIRYLDKWDVDDRANLELALAASATEDELYTALL